MSETSYERIEIPEGLSADEYLESLLVVTEADFMRVGAEQQYPLRSIKQTWYGINDHYTRYEYDKQRLEELDPRQLLHGIVRIFVEAGRSMEGLRVKEGRLSAQVLRKLVESGSLYCMPGIDQGGARLAQGVVRDVLELDNWPSGSYTLSQS